ncbi:MAG: alpha-L-fucosidase [Verrucomicrobiales bacterium]|nr:alpha-L-fucosidase [Verrucomicrobiota bacterium JB025]
MKLLALLILLTSLATAAPPSPHGATPHPRQLAWQQLQYYGFVHLGLNTFTDREWGFGDEDPALFNPEKLDARAIARTFRQAGMTGLILTAKHHDGFCLWPTRTTPYNISKSPWKNGKGDLVREFADACRAENIRFGIYISPWDRNHPEYARPGYVTTFHKQITEVVTNYGPLFEFWFDGANGGDGHYGGARETRTIPPNYYRFPAAKEIIRKHQPNCVIWGAGDARWAGNENGTVAYQHWHTMDTRRPGNLATGVPHGDLWQPAEADTSIRPGWFWHENEDTRVKSPTELLDIWFLSVGRGSNLILNVPPDSSGRLRQPDIDSLLAFKNLRDQLLATDFAAAASTAGPSKPGHPTANLTNSNKNSYWTTGNLNTPTAEIRLKQATAFDVIHLREHIALGQRVESFAIDARLDGTWQTIHTGPTIGSQRLARLPLPVITDRLRLRITASPSPPCISQFAIHQLPALPKSPTTQSSAGLSKSAWKITHATAGDATLAIDGDPATIWHTHTHLGEAGQQPPPQSFTVDLGSTTRITAFTYLPRQDGVTHGMTDRYRFETSTDGTTWQTAAEGEFSNIRANPVARTVTLPKPVTATHFRFTALRALEKNHVSAAEIGIISAK